jgi:chromosome segregation ATPase
MGEAKNKFEELEDKIRKLIISHQELKGEIEALKKEKQKLVKQVEADKSRMKWVEDGYNNLQSTEKHKTEKTISQLKKKINSLVSEIDKSIELIDTSN